MGRLQGVQPLHPLSFSVFGTKGHRAGLVKLCIRIITKFQLDPVKRNIVRDDSTTLVSKPFQVHSVNDIESILAISYANSIQSEPGFFRSTCFAVCRKEERNRKMKPFQGFFILFKIGRLYFLPWMVTKLTIE